ncbi:MAG: TetR/AcrR family transcriptional regulator [Salinivirgaceae bacterium]|jgi:AcrR family transcriptional regulator|nr:TetR/AcrR family transcriptional regulator [Salinivirgaceae bacterium]
MDELKFTKKPGAKEKRYEHIIDAAQSILVQKGYDNATFGDIAKAANYNKRTLYIYFSGKDDIFAAVVLRILTKLDNHLRKNINNTGNGFDTLINLTSAYFSFFFINKKFYNLLWSFEERYFLFGKNTHESPNINKTYHTRRKNVQLIADTYQRGLNDGSVKQSDNPQLIISLLWSQTLGVLQLVSRGEYMLTKDYKIKAQDIFDKHIEYLENTLRNT